MEPNRTDLNNLGSNRSYLVVAIILIVLSCAGMLSLFLILKQKPLIFPLKPATPTQAPAAPSPLPTDLPPTPSPPDLFPTSLPVSPRPESTPIPTSPPPSPEPTVDPQGVLFTSDTDKFQVYYQPGRKLYQDTQPSGNRYTFWSASGTITVHAGPDWSWSIPDRPFSSDFTVSGRPTFRYDIAQQSIIDFENNTQKYTIQCLHGGLDTQKTECLQFAAAFRLL